MIGSSLFRRWRTIAASLMAGYLTIFRSPSVQGARVRVRTGVMVGVGELIERRASFNAKISKLCLFESAQSSPGALEQQPAVSLSDFAPPWELSGTFISYSFRSR